MKKKKEDDLSPRARAEDILLGSLGFGEDAKLVKVERTAQGYRGEGVWPDGEKFKFENDDPLDDLQVWALAVLVAG
jgi:hypothetical protein